MPESSATQKVISVNVKAASSGAFYEMDFPAVTAALNEGYFVKQVVPIPFSSTSTVGFTTIVFVLDKAR